MEKDQILKIIANNIRTLMQHAELSSTVVANRCKISTGTISKILNGDMSITVPMAMILAEGLGVSVNDILEGLAAEPHKKKTAKKNTASTEKKLCIGILSLNKRRTTCITDHTGKIIGTSDLDGDLDLAEPSGHLMQLILTSIKEALPETQTSQSILKYAQVNLVTQSYEFEEKREKFRHYAERQFKDVILMPDWQITYLADFKNSPGISLVMDKGVSLSFSHNGDLKKLSGWKFPVYDLGGENWLGVETIRHTIEAVEGYIPMTALAENIIGHFNGKIERITETCFASRDADIYCSFYEMLLRQYFMGDKAAKNIIERGFLAISKIVQKADSLLGKELKIAVHGSLTDIYKPFIDKKRLTKSTSKTEQVHLLAHITKEFLEERGVKHTPMTHQETP